MRRSIKITLALGVVVAVGLGVTGAASADRWPRNQFTAAALAVPAAPGTSAHADATRFELAQARTVKVDGVATTSLTCDGCTGHALTTQVIYLRRAGAFTADNIATAWASGCTGCSGWALSLQVVVARFPGEVTAANHALALNASCVNCDTRSAAVQLVVVAPWGRALSRRAIASIMALRQQLVAELTAAPAPAPAPVTAPTPATASTPAAAPRAKVAPTRPQVPGPAQPQAGTAGSAAAARVTATAEQIQSVLTADLHARSATHDVQVTG